MQPGDSILLFLSMDNVSSSVTPPAGWTEVTGVSDDPMRTIVWSKVAGAADAGATVNVRVGTTVRASLMTMAYSGTSQTSPVLAAAAAGESVQRVQHTTPPLTTSARSRVISYVADLSTTTAWTKAAGQRVRGVAYGTGTPHFAVLATEHVTTLPAGTHGNVTATANTSSATATMLTIALALNN